MKTSEFDYILPERFIAQVPVEPRDTSRLLVVHKRLDALEHVHFYDLPRFLNEGDVLVFNQTKVIAARLFGLKMPSGGKVEILLIRQMDPLTWEVLIGGKNVKVGQRIQIVNGPEFTILDTLGGARRVGCFREPIAPELSRIGHVPLPPYIHSPLSDPDRYQTVFARYPGSVAAPTAGLHFTRRLFADLESRGIVSTFVTLHIGLDTFAPVLEDEIQQHAIHSEWCRLDQKTANVINRAKHSGRRIIAVGTTSVRTLETAYRQDNINGDLTPFEGKTDLFITPGYQFELIDAMITNFHLPRSTLIMMVSAFFTHRKLISIYGNSQAMDYRFYSFGDAMLII